VLDAIEANQPFESSTYGIPDLDECILGVKGFSLWYGESRALYDIAMNVPKGQGDGACRTIGLRQVHAAPLGQPAQRSCRRRAHRAATCG
jgi:hypothetical protein